MSAGRISTGGALKEGTGTPDAIEADIFLAAMGRKPTSDGVGLAQIGATLDPKGGAVKVDASFHVDGAPEQVVDEAIERLLVRQQPPLSCVCYQC